MLVPMLRRGLFLILALGLCLPLASAAPTKPPAVSKEMQLKGAISEELAKLASWCLGKHLMPEGRALVDEALSLKADPEVQALKGRLAKEIKPYDDAQIRKDFEAKRTQMGKKLTGLYKDLFTQPHSADQQTAYDVYLLRAYDFDAKAIMPLVEAAIQDAGKRDDYPREKHLLEAAEALHDDPAWVKGLEILELRASNVKPILKKASTHPLQYKLSLPKGWTPDKRWPILVAVEGSGCNWDAYMNGFLSQRGDLPFIVVVPLTFSNTGLLNKDSDPYPKEILDKYN